MADWHSVVVTWRGLAMLVAVWVVARWLALRVLGATAVVATGVDLLSLCLAAWACLIASSAVRRDAYLMFCMWLALALAHQRQVWWWQLPPMVALCNAESMVVGTRIWMPVALLAFCAYRGYWRGMVPQ